MVKKIQLAARHQPSKSDEEVKSNLSNADLNDNDLNESFEALKEIEIEMIMLM